MYSALLLLLTVSGPAFQSTSRLQQTSQTAAAPEVRQQAGPAAAAQKLPVDTARIRVALAQEPRIRFDAGTARFHVEIVGRTRSFEEMVGGVDLKHGPVPRSGMMHQDYVSMVTPRQLREPAGAAAGEALQAGLVSAGAGRLISALLGKWEKALNARELRQVRERIERELRELEKRRGGGR